MIRVGLIGFGAIGRAVWQAIRDGEAGETQCSAILVRRPRADQGAPLVADADAFLSGPMDAVLECAGHDAVAELGERVLRSGADFIVTSAGALVDDARLASLQTAAAESGSRLVIPSAGIGALDILGAAAVGGLSRVAVTVRKDPASWLGTAAEEICDLSALASARILYEGPVREGARLYPANVNISAAVALTGCGADRTRLRIVADPAIETHVVEVEAEGAFGRFRFSEDVLPSIDNRKTGRIVAMALIKTLRQRSASMVFGA